MDDVKRIAEGLTKAQADCLIAKQRVAGRLAEWRQLVDWGLIDMRVRTSSILTPLGIAVRAYLEKNHAE